MAGLLVVLFRLDVVVITFSFFTFCFCSGACLQKALDAVLKERDLNV